MSNELERRQLVVELVRIQKAAWRLLVDGNRPALDGRVLAVEVADDREEAAGRPHGELPLSVVVVARVRAACAAVLAPDQDEAAQLILRLGVVLEPATLDESDVVEVRDRVRRPELNVGLDRDRLYEVAEPEQERRESPERRQVAHDALERVERPLELLEASKRRT